MKRIGIDFLPVESSPAGIGQYTIGLLRELWKLDTENIYIVYSTKPIDEEYLKHPNVKNVIVKWPDRFPLKGIRWMNNVIKQLHKERIDLFLSTSNNYFALNFPRTIQFIHDLSPMHFPELYKLNARLLYTATSKLALTQAKHIVTISESVRKELVNLNPKAKDKISVINAFINENILVESQKYTGITPDTNYILTISGFDPKKNLELSLRVFARLIRGLEFRDYKYYVIGKKAWHYEKILETIKELGIEENVVLMGYVDDCYIADIVSKSKCMLLLSKYEGFGMTPLESLYFNVPVVVSDIPVFREILSDMSEMVTFVDCNDEETLEIASQALSDAIRSKRIDTKDKVTKIYSAGKSAKELLNIINHY